jgi:hypothetical protein
VAIALRRKLPKRFSSTYKAFSAKVSSAAFATANGEGNDDAVANFQLVDIFSNLDHFAHRLMAHNVAGLHTGDKTAHEMEVGTA